MTATFEWVDASSVFGFRQEALVGGLLLTVFGVVGGSNTDAEPFGWSVDTDEDEIDGGPAASPAEGRRLAEQAARRL